MLNFCIKNLKISVSYFFLCLIAFFIAIDRTGTFSLSLLAAFLHELGHISAMLILKIGLTSLSFSLGRVWIATPISVSPSKNLIISLSGPSVNILLWAFCRLLNIGASFGLINLALAIFNLLPIKGLDGGDALASLCELTRLKRSGPIIEILSVLGIGAVILLGGAVFWLSRGNFSMLIVALYLIILYFRKN